MARIPFLSETSIVSSSPASPKKDQYVSGSFFLSLILPLIGIVLLLIATAPWGIGANSDSSNYIAGARNLLKGLGYSNARSLSPITHWPPFFSFTLAAIGLFGIDPLEGARILNSSLFGVNILMMGLILKELTGSRTIACLGAFLTLTSQSMLTIHGWACSEPWFIFLSFTGFFLLVRYLGNGRKRLLFAASGLAGLACLDRYAGIALLPAGILTILLLHQKGFLNRTKDSLLYFAVSFFPLSLWFLRNHFVAGDSPTDRAFIVHSPSLKYFFDLFHTLSGWVLFIEFPPFLRYATLSIAFLVLSSLVVFMIQQEVRKQSLSLFIRDASFRFIASMAIFALCYTGLHLTYQLVVNASVTADDRHFSPLFVTILLSSLVLLNRFFVSCPNHKAFKAAILVSLIFFSLSSVYTSSQFLMQLSKQGNLFTTRQWKTSPTILQLKVIPPEARIYSNEPTVLYLNANRVAWRLPGKYNRRQYRNPKSARPKDILASQLQKVREKLLKKNGYVVFFTKRHKWSNLTQAEIERYLPIVAIYELEDGSIYKTDPSRNVEPTP